MLSRQDGLPSEILSSSNNTSKDNRLLKTTGRKSSSSTATKKMLSSRHRRSYSKDSDTITAATILDVTDPFFSPTRIRKSDYLLQRWQQESQQIQEDSCYVLNGPSGTHRSCGPVDVDAVECSSSEDGGGGDSEDEKEHFRSTKSNTRSSGPIDVDAVDYLSSGGDSEDEDPPHQTNARSSGPGDEKQRQRNYPVECTRHSEYLGQRHRRRRSCGPVDVDTVDDEYCSDEDSDDSDDDMFNVNSYSGFASNGERTAEGTDHHRGFDVFCCCDDFVLDETEYWNSMMGYQDGFEPEVIDISSLSLVADRDVMTESSSYLPSRKLSDIEEEAEADRKPLSSIKMLKNIRTSSLSATSKTVSLFSFSSRRSKSSASF